MFLIVLLLCCEEIGINNTVNSRLVFKILTQLYLVVDGTNESHAIGIEIEMTMRRVTWDKIFHFARLCVVFFIIIFSIKRRSYEMKVSSSSRSKGEENEQSVLFFVVAYGKMEEKKSLFSLHSCWWWKWSEKRRKKMENVKKIFLKTNLRLLLMMMLVGGEINNCAWAVDYMNFTLSIPHL